MGLLYKSFQSLAYDGLEWGVQKGKKYNKKHCQNDDIPYIHVSFNHLDNLINKLNREQEEKHLFDNYYFEDFDDDEF